MVGVAARGTATVRLAGVAHHIDTGVVSRVVFLRIVWKHAIETVTIWHTCRGLAVSVKGLSHACTFTVGMDHGTLLRIAHVLLPTAWSVSRENVRAPSPKNASLGLVKHNMQRLWIRCWLCLSASCGHQAASDPQCNPTCISKAKSASSSTTRWTIAERPRLARILELGPMVRVYWVCCCTPLCCSGSIVLLHVPEIALLAV
jgi:hypothetical protein